MKAKLPLIIVIVVVVALVVIAIILGGIKQPGEKGEQSETLTDLKDVAIAEEIYGFSAEIKGIKDKTMILEAWIPMADQNAEPIKGTVKAVITDNTKIIKLKFPEEIPTDTSEPVYPEEIDITFDELKIGDKIDVGTNDNAFENIKNGTEFLLNHIFIIE